LRHIVYKLVLDEEPDVAKRTQRIAQELGLFVNTDLIIPMMIAQLSDAESKQVPRFVSSCLTSMALVIEFTSDRHSTFNSHLKKLIDMIKTSDFLFSENLEVMICTSRVIRQVVKAGAQQGCLENKQELFKILLQLGSLP